MAEYHVKCNTADNIIYVVSSDETVKTDVTEECFDAVREHLARIATWNKLEDIGYRWDFDDGTTTILKLIENKKENEDV